jgi:uncharacterized protein
MRIIRFLELRQVPWKNGGGITREIAVSWAGDSLIWRLSMADVAVDGPFSKFDGLQRILTVIEGNGMELTNPNGRLQADYGVPVHFDGALDIQSRLKDGPLRDLNLIYDPALCEGDVAVIAGNSTRLLRAATEQIYAIHCVAGKISVNETELLQIGDTALIESGVAQFDVPVHANALLITLTFPTQPEASSSVTAAR